MNDINYRKVVSVTENDMINFNYNHHVRMEQFRMNQAKLGKLQDFDRKDYESYKMLIRNIPQGGHCLEIGSAWGRQFDILSTRFEKLSGIDVHQPSINRGKELGRDIQYSTLEHTPFPDDTFDVVVSRHVLEHTYDVQGAINEIKRILKPGGFAGAITPHFFPDYELAHTTQLGMMEWVKEYSKAGFKVVSAEIHFFIVEECHIVVQKSEGI